jgi:hypothetical protein
MLQIVLVYYGTISVTMFIYTVFIVLGHSTHPPFYNTHIWDTQYTPERDVTEGENLLLN